VHGANQHENPIAQQMPPPHVLDLVQDHTAKLGAAQL